MDWDRTRGLLEKKNCSRKSLGTDTNFRGAIRLLAMIKEQSTLPSTVSLLKYETVPYPTSDASLK